MSRLTSFFSGVDTAFGVFFQKHHILAAYPNFAAQRCGEGIEMGVECDVTGS